MQRVGYTAARYAWRPRLQMMKQQQQQQQQQHDPSNERWNKVPIPVATSPSCLSPTLLPLSYPPASISPTPCSRPASTSPPALPLSSPLYLCASLPSASVKTNLISLLASMATCKLELRIACHVSSLHTNCCLHCSPLTSLVYPSGTIRSYRTTGTMASSTHLICPTCICITDSQVVLSTSQTCFSTRTLVFVPKHLHRQLIVVVSLTKSL